MSTTDRPAAVTLASAGASDSVAAAASVNAPADGEAGSRPHPHAQSGYQVRFDWGLDGALLLADAHVVVVVDAMSFSTTVELAVTAGVEVVPWGAADDGAVAFASAHGAVLVTERDGGMADVHRALGIEPGTAPEGTAPAGAVPEGTAPAGAVPEGTADAAPAGAAESDSGASDGAGLERGRRVVLPSPDGGAIARVLADRGVTVVVGSFRNRAAVADWVLAEQGRLGGRATVAVIAAGKSRDSGALRPAVEDQLAAGGILDALTDVGIDHCSPEAAATAAAFHGLRRGIGHLLTASASAEERQSAASAASSDSAASGASSVSAATGASGEFAASAPRASSAADLDAVRRLDVSRTVPVLREFSFRS